MISFNITEDYPGAEVRAIKELINSLYGVPRSIYDDVDTLKNQMLEVLGRLDNISTDFIPEKAENLNDKDLNQCVGRIIFGYGNNCINKPTGSNGYLINIPHDGRGDLFNKQLWLTRPQNQVFVRNMDNGTFTEWVPIRFDSGWNKLTLASGISEQNSSQYPCRFRKVNNQVFVDGCVKGVNSVNTVVATLPDGYRPSKSYYFQNATGGGKTSTFRVHTDGRIELLFSTGTIATDSYHFITTNFLAD